MYFRNKLRLAIYKETKSEVMPMQAAGSGWRCCWWTRPRRDPRPGALHEAGATRSTVWSSPRAAGAFAAAGMAKARGCATGGCAQQLQALPRTGAEHTRAWSRNIWTGRLGPGDRRDMELESCRGCIAGLLVQFQDPGASFTPSVIGAGQSVPVSISANASSQSSERNNRRRRRRHTQTKTKQVRAS